MYSTKISLKTLDKAGSTLPRMVQLRITKFATQKLQVTPCKVSCFENGSKSKLQHRPDRGAQKNFLLVVTARHNSVDVTEIHSESTEHCPKKHKLQVQIDK